MRSSFSIVGAALVLGGCASYTIIDPIVAGSDLAKAPPPPGKALLSMQTNTILGEVTFSRVSADQLCQREAPLASVVRTTAERVRETEVTSKLKSMVGLRSAPQLPAIVHVLVDAGKPLNIAANYFYSTPQATSHCGPVFAGFTPEEGRSYVASFVFGSQRSSSSCSLVLNPVTAIETPIAQRRWTCTNALNLPTSEPRNMREITVPFIDLAKEFPMTAR